MASSAATEAIEVRRRGRRRLVGAIAIVALLVVFVPMLLDTEPKHESADPSMQIPSPDKVAPLPPPLPGKAPPAAPPPAVTAAVTPTPAVTPAPLKAVTPAPALPQPPAAAPTLQGFAVQVGAYRDEKTLG